MQACRRGLSMVELLVVVGIIAILAGLLLVAIQKARDSALRSECQNNLRQMGLALYHYNDANQCFPPGMVSSSSNVCDAETTGFSFLLPFLEQDNTYRLYHFDDPWSQASNYDAVGTSVKVFYCPANRNEGAMDLGPIAAQWGVSLPPKAASCDYAFCKGANGALPQDWQKTPLQVRGVFSVRSLAEPSGLKINEITDGTNHTMLMGEAAGGTTFYLVRDLNNPNTAAIDAVTGKPAMVEQSWGAAGCGDPSHPWYGSVFAVTAQYGLSPDPRDEPMNRRLVTPTIYGGDPAGDNLSGKDMVSGFRSRHSGGCNFLFADGSVIFLSDLISPDIYRALSTYAGSELVREGDY